MIRASNMLGEERTKRIVGRLDGLTRLATLEQVLAVVCILIPAGLIAFDGWHVRDSVCAYYDMSENEWFYVPITTASMLFIVNGVVKKARFYNWILGVALLLVLMFDHEGGASVVHFFGAIVFFAGNGAVMLLHADTALERQLRWPLIGVIVASMLAWLLSDWFTLFWAEWISLLVIGLHFFINSRESRQATALAAAA